MLADLPRVLLRRWYLMLLGAAATVLLCVLAARAVPIRYTTHAELLLLPATASTAQGSNPYVSLGGLSPAGDVLSKAMTDDLAQKTLKAAGVSGEYTVARDLASSAPLVLVNVKSPSRDASLSSLRLILARAPVTLQHLQRELDIENRAFITMTVITQSGTAEPLRTPQIRAVLVALVAGVAGTLLGVAALDSALLVRRQKALGHTLDTVSDGDEGARREQPPAAPSHARLAPGSSSRSA